MSNHDDYTLDPWNDTDWTDEPCPACGEDSDYCQGHGPIGDPDGYAVLVGAGWVDLADDDDYEEPSGPSAEQERMWDEREDALRGNALD